VPAQGQNSQRVLTDTRGNGPRRQVTHQKPTSQVRGSNMRYRVCLVLAVGVLLAGVWGAGSEFRRAAGSRAGSRTTQKRAHAPALENYAALPLSFEANQGQADTSVGFLARGQGYTLFLTSQRAVLFLQKLQESRPRHEELGGPDAGSTPARLQVLGDHMSLEPRLEARSGKQRRGLQGAATTNSARLTAAGLQMQLLGANSGAETIGEDRLPGKNNYFIGNDPKKWRTNIPTYAKVRMENVYPGVDLVYYGNQGQLEYDFVLQPGADPHAIKLAFNSFPSDRTPSDSSAASEQLPVRIDANGDLVVPVHGGEVRFHKPVIYQSGPGEDTQAVPHRISVGGSYALTAKNEVTLAIGEYDKSRPLVIDPVLVYSTYLGGSQQEQGYGIAVNASDNIYVTGYTLSKDFPTSNALQASNNSALPDGASAFVTKFTADGSALLYSTYLGGSATAYAYGIAVDRSGNAYLTGQTDSTDFPTVNAVQAAYAGEQDSFVSKLSADGSALLYSTYLGGSGNDEAYGIAVDGSDSAYVIGRTDSTNFPTTSGAFQTTIQGPINAFVTKFTSDGSALAYSTYLGGNRGDQGAGIAVDASGSAYVTGSTVSTNFPTVNAFQSSLQDIQAAFVTKFTADGSALLYSTYLGGSSRVTNGILIGGSGGRGIAVDRFDNAYVTGATYCTNFPVTSNAFQASNRAASGEGQNAFVTKFDASGSVPVYSTYLGGSIWDQATAIALNSFGNAFVTGYTEDSDFPTVNPIQANNNAASTGGRNAFVTEFTSGGSGLAYSTYLGGSAEDMAYGISVDRFGNAYITGGASSSNFPTANAFQATKNNQSFTVFVAKIVGNSAAFVVSNAAASIAPSGSLIAYIITALNKGPDTATGVNIVDVIPVGTTFAGVFVSSGSCTAPAFGGTGAVTCTIPSVGVNSADAVIEALIVNVTAAAGSTITDTATLSAATFNPNSANDSASATTGVIF
jgi:uncharacterized repeat protein (TIGR01451 family)